MGNSSAGGTSRRLKRLAYALYAIGAVLIGAGIIYLIRA